MPIELRTRAEIDAIARAGRILDDVLAAGVAAATPGSTTALVGERVAAEITRLGGEPILTNYPGVCGEFGHACCVCVNEEVVHSPPRGRIIRPGDVVTIDSALRFPPGELGWCVDAAVSVAIPSSDSSRAGRLIESVEACLSAALALCRSGARWSAVAAEAGRIARSRGCVLAPEYCGHGIGRTLHEMPRVGFGMPAAADFTLRPGMVFTIEPIAMEGEHPPEFVTLDDGWTVLAADRRWSAHRELTLAITPAGPLVLAGQSVPAAVPPSTLSTL